MSRLPQEARQGRGDRGKTRSAVNDATVQCPVLQCRVHSVSAGFRITVQSYSSASKFWYTVPVKLEDEFLKTLVTGSRPIILALSLKCESL